MVFNPKGALFASILTATACRDHRPATCDFTNSSAGAAFPTLLRVERNWRISPPLQIRGWGMRNGKSSNDIRVRSTDGEARRKKDKDTLVCSSLAERALLYLARFNKQPPQNWSRGPDACAGWRIPSGKALHTSACLLSLLLFSY